MAGEGADLGLEGGELVCALGPPPAGERKWTPAALKLTVEPGPFAQGNWVWVSHTEVQGVRLQNAISQPAPLPPPARARRRLCNQAQLAIWALPHRRTTALPPCPRQRGLLQEG